MLTSENWNTLPVLKGKFYQHPRLTDSVNHMAAEKAEKKKAQQKREKQLKNQPVPNLPDEDITSCLLDEIFPRTPTAPQRERDSVTFDTLTDLVIPMTPTGENVRKSTTIKPRMSPAGSKRMSSHEFSRSDTVKMEIDIPNSASNAAGQTMGSVASTNFNTSTNFGGSGMLSSSSGMAVSREAAAAQQHLQIMLEFRKTISERFSTIKDAFDSFEKEFPANREMTKKEWRRVLVKLGFTATVEERDAIFEQLDIDGSGHVSMMEFHIAIEAAAPVRTMEDLRRRWLASSYTSMSQAISFMDDNGVNTNKRLTLREFGEALSRAHVLDHTEHLTLFNAIADHSDPRNSKTTVSIGELACAVATVSPAAYLEEVRQRLMKRYSNAEKAFWDIDRDHSGIVSKGEFKSRAIHRMGLTEMEAEKMFNTIDFDNNGSIVLSEFLCALSMSEPSLFYEDLRKKVRQRFRSIREAFDKAMQDFRNDDLHKNPKLTLQRFQLLLQEMELTDPELRTLFDLIDANKDGALTIKEFVHGIRFFAPSCVLEDLRLQCLQRFEFVADAFADTSVDRMAPLDLEAFTNVLEKQGLIEGVEVEAVFHLLDVRNENSITLAKLIAALQSGGPGNNRRPSSEERDGKATQDIKTCLLQHHRAIGDLKLTVRQGLKTPENALNRQTSKESGCTGPPSEAGGSEVAVNSTDFQGAQRQGRPGSRKQEGSTVALRAQAWSSDKPSPKKANVGSNQGNQKLNNQEATGGEKEAKAGEEEVLIAPSNVAPRLRPHPQEDLAKYMAKIDPDRITEHKKFAQDPVDGAKQTWGQLWQCLHNTSDAKERAELEKQLLMYFQGATGRMSHDMPFFERSHSRFAVHRSVRAHTKALAQNRVPRM